MASRIVQQISLSLPMTMPFGHPLSSPTSLPASKTRRLAVLEPASVFSHVDQSSLSGKFWRRSDLRSETQKLLRQHTLMVAYRVFRDERQLTVPLFSKTPNFYMGSLTITGL